MSVWNDVIGPADHPAAFIYCSETVGEGRHVHARMFAPSLGIAEDPCDGRRRRRFRRRLHGVRDAGRRRAPDHRRAGLCDGRPSLINLGMTVEGGALVSASIGGAAIVVCEGEIEI